MRRPAPLSTVPAGVALIAAIVCPAALTVRAQGPIQTRDATAPQLGTGVLTGIVTTADEPARPLRYVTLTLAGPTIRPERLTSSDGDGRFVFADLPPGRYMLSASRTGFVRDAYGSRRPGGSGSSIAIHPGSVANVTMRLLRTATIAGTVRMPAGAPLSSIRVLAMQYSWSNGVRRLAPTGGAYGIDDRGEYRIPGLTPGEYIVAADVTTGGVSHSGDVTTASELRAVSAEEIQWARRQLQTSPAAGPPPSPPPMQPLVGFAPVYYPSVTDPASAASIAVAPGDDRGGVDIELTLAPLADVSGVVVGPNGLPVSRAIVAVATEEFVGFRAPVATDDEGRFAFQRLRPGQFTLVARARLEAAASPAVRPGPTLMTPDMPLWATQVIRVDGRDRSDIMIQLQQGATVAGRVVFDGATAKPRASAYAVALTAPASRLVTAAALPGMVNDDRSFVITGVAPGRYRVSVGLTTGSAAESAWHFTGVSLETTAAVDDVIDVRPPSDVAGLVVTFTDRPTEITGRLTAATGLPAPDHFIVAFPADPNLWTFQSRRIMSVRPSTDGEFLLRALPPGDYLIAALTDINTLELQDPRFLQTLVAGAVPISLAEHERKRQDLRIR